MFYELLLGLEETFFMIFAAGLIMLLLGIPLGIFLNLFAKSQKFWKKALYNLIQLFINFTASTPYLALLVLLIPLMRFLFGSEASLIAAIFSISFATLFHFAKQIQLAYNKLPPELYDLARSFGISRLRFTSTYLLKEITPSILKEYGQHLNQLLGYSIIAGVFGAGGLGGLLIEKGYANFQITYVLAIISLLVIMTQGIRFSLQYLSHGQSH